MLSAGPSFNTCTAYCSMASRNFALEATRGFFFNILVHPTKMKDILSSWPRKNRALNLETIFSAERRVGIFIQPSQVWVFVDEEKCSDIYLDQLLLEAYLTSCLSRLTYRNSECRYFSSSHHGQPGCDSHCHSALDQLCSRVEISLICRVNTIYRQEIEEHKPGRERQGRIFVYR